MKITFRPLNYKFGFDEKFSLFQLNKWWECSEFPRMKNDTFQCCATSRPEMKDLQWDKTVTAKHQRVTLTLCRKGSCLKPCIVSVSSSSKLLQRLISFTICVSEWKYWHSPLEPLALWSNPVLWSSLIEWPLLQNRLVFVDSAPSLCQEKKGHSEGPQSCQDTARFSYVRQFEHNAWRPLISSTNEIPSRTFLNGRIYFKIKFIFTSMGVYFHTV